MAENGEYIVKRVVHPGRKSAPFNDGTKIYFHFQTKLNETVLDDSRKMGPGEPLHIVLGKKFKLEVWEACLQKMAIGEVAEFHVDKSLVIQYPFVAKTLRDIHKPVNERGSTHSCAMSLQTHGVGYKDLNELLNGPKDLDFIFEIVNVQQPEEYEKETWQMDEAERIDLIPKLKELGNSEYHKKNYVKAAEYYGKAIGMLEQFMLKEKPHDEDWNKLNEQKLLFLLNFSQCKYYEGDYYAVITHCTEVIKYDPNNVKAYFRRGKAHIEAWNPNEAKTDFEKVIQLDGSLEKLATTELSTLERLQKDQDKQDKEKFKNIFST